jgi:phosphate transport system substrate-binding protein
MKLILNFSAFFAIILSTLFFCCKNSNNDKETILKGSATVIVDETLQPIIEDQIAVFEGEYNASIKLDSKSESEVSRDLLKDSAQIVVLSRQLNKDEIKHFENIKIKPRVTQVATDAIALIRNKKSNDTLIALQDVLDFMKGRSNSAIKGLVFDNPNSSTMRLLIEMAGLKGIPEKEVYYFKKNEEVVKYVSENDGVIGVVGLNWLYRPTPKIEEYLKNVNVLNVKGIGKADFFAPSQNNIAEGTYPLARDLFIINCQGASGLGMGFASFVAGDIGQRIVLKSGLLPIRMPSRKLLIKNRI